MGQQQLLLLVLGIVIVGLAVVAGINAFEQNQKSSSQDAITQEAFRLATTANAWYRKPEEFGGGGGDSNGNVTLGDLTLSTINADGGTPWGTITLTATAGTGGTPGTADFELTLKNASAAYACVTLDPDATEPVTFAEGVCS